MSKVANLSLIVNSTLIYVLNRTVENLFLIAPNLTDVSLIPPPPRRAAQRLLDVFDALEYTWSLSLSTLVLFTFVGFSLVEKGLSRIEGTRTLLLRVLASAALSSVLYWLLGYGISFGSGSFWGLSKELYALWSADNLHAHFFHQMLVCLVALVVCFQGLAERGALWVYIVLTPVYTLLVHAPITHWLWSTEGFLNSVNAIDLNGGLVVHLAAGSAALVLTWSFIHLKKQIRGATGGGREPVFCCCFFVFLPPSNV